MNTNKILIAGLIGGVVAFFLGWIVYGMALQGFFEQHAGTATGVTKGEADMVWWAMIVAHLAFGYLYALIFGRWANISTFATGAKAGAVIGLLMGLAYGLIWYGTSNVMDLTGTMVDILAGAFNSAIIGGVVAWWLGRK